MTLGMEIASSGWKMYVPILILFTINLLNYMDRYTVAGVLTDIQDYYNIDDAQGGLIQTMFMAFYIIFSPTCGFLGDRYNRKWIMVTGITLWIIIVFSSSFVPSNMFWLFLVLRGMVGVGEASYAIISPSVIADMYTGLVRSRMLMIFYFATPVGSGLGFVVGSAVSSLFGHWQWGVRITSIFGVICLALIIFVIREPERGKAEREIGIISSTTEIKRTAYLSDLWSLCKNATYMTSTFAYTSLVFGVGTLYWWMPAAIEHYEAFQLNLNSTNDLPDDKKNQINLLFGIITCVAGLLGVTMGTVLSNFISTGYGPFKYIQTKRSDAVVCAIGAYIGVPTMFFGIWAIDKSLGLTWSMIFIASVVLSFNWAINVDMLMSVVIPSRRNTANAFQILTSHLLGDGSGPYILGAISDAIRGDDDSPYAHYQSLSKAFYIAVGVLFLGAVLYTISAFTVLKDQQIFAEQMGSLVEDKKGISSESEQIEEDKAYAVYSVDLKM